MKETSRRAILAGIAATPAVAVPALATEPEPVFAVLAEYVRCRDAYFSASARLDEAEGQTTEQRPIPLIAWRNYSHIGCSEIDRVREEFLAAPDADAEQIEREYREAKATERAAQQAAEDWYVRNGLAELKAESGKAWEAHVTALRALFTTKPTTIAGMIALLEFTAAHSGERAEAEGTNIFSWVGAEEPENFYKHLADSLRAIGATS